MPPETESADTPGARVRALRAAAGLTQAQLAGRLDWAPQRIGNLENSPWRLRKPTVARLAAALGCAPGAIDPSFGDVTIPARSLCLTPDPDLAGVYRPHRPADAGRLAELGWPEAVDHARLAELSEACRAAGAGLYLMP
jgi:transcriptional regulator with XRE-family HTH domain